MNCYYQSQIKPVQATQMANCAPPVPFPCKWDVAAKQHVCTAPNGAKQYYACQSSAYGIYNYGATVTPVGPFYK